MSKKTATFHSHKDWSVLFAFCVTVFLALVLAYFSRLIFSEVSQLQSLAADKNVEINVWAIFAPYLWMVVSYCVPAMIGSWVFAICHDKDVRADFWDNLIIPAFATVTPVAAVTWFISPIADSQVELVEALTSQEITQLLSIAVSGFWISAFRLCRKAYYVHKYPDSSAAEARVSNG